MDLEQFETLSLNLCVSGLILYMLFIIYKLGKESNAGKFGYFVLFIGLGTFAKTIIVAMLIP